MVFIKSNSISNFSKNYTPNSKDKIINSNSNISVLIYIPQGKFNEHDYIGCIMGYGGTTINLIQKLTNTDIKINNDYMNQHIKISNKSNHLSISQVIINLNKAAMFITTLIKLKHTEDIPNSKFNVIKTWQDNEKKIVEALNKELQKLNESKIDESFINKYALKKSIIKHMKDNTMISFDHDSEMLPIINDFTKYINLEPDIDTVTKKFYFKNQFTKYYTIFYNKYFKCNNIIIRGNLMIDDYIQINFKNYTNFFTEIHDYDESSVNFHDLYVKNPSEVYIRPESCIPSFETIPKDFNIEINKTGFISPTPVVTVV